MTRRGLLAGKVRGARGAWLQIAFGTLALASTIGCANREAQVARVVGSPCLQCDPAETDVVLNRQTPVVREWMVACDFMYTRVHCTDRGCERAEPKPPCIGDLTCFEEDPVTLRWELPQHAARR